MSWFVTGLTDPTQTSGTVTPYYFQAASKAAAEKQIGGPPLAGPFKTKADAQAWVKAHPEDFGPGKTGGKALAPNLAAPELATAGSNPLAGLASIGDFFSRLTSPHTWLRVAEFVVGGIFLVLGLNALLHNPIGKAAKAAPKVVPI
jgi:hypothetical protein